MIRFAGIWGASPVPNPGGLLCALCPLCIFARFELRKDTKRTKGSRGNTTTRSDWEFERPNVKCGTLGCAIHACMMIRHGRSPTRPISDALSAANACSGDTHVRPDAMPWALVCAALVLAMQKRISRCSCCCDRLPNNYCLWSPKAASFITNAEGELAAGLILPTSTRCRLDPGTWSQLPGLKERVSGWKGAKALRRSSSYAGKLGGCEALVTEAARRGNRRRIDDRWNVSRWDKFRSCRAVFGDRPGHRWFHSPTRGPYVHSAPARG